MGKLYDTLNNIEDGRKLCVKYLNEQNITTPEDANIHKIATNIQLGVNGIDMWNTSTPLTDSNKDLKTFITTIPLLDTSQVTDMNYMFQDCTALTTIPPLDTSKVTNMNAMFGGCKLLTTIPLLNTSQVTNMNYMFYECRSLTLVPPLDTSKVTNMSYMFQDCTALTTIPPLDTSKVTNMNAMFGYCTSLQEINLNKAPILPNCSMTYTFDGIPSNCLIRVYDETSKQKVLASRSNLTNVVVEPYSGGNQ